MSENIEKLRRAIGRVHADCDCNWCSAVRDADAALAAVEREMAALTMDRDHCQRLYIEACESGSGHARIAALEAERDELRKRPTLEEVLRVVAAWDYDNRHSLSRWADTEPEDKKIDARVRALYAEKAAR